MITVAQRLHDLAAHFDRNPQLADGHTRIDVMIWPADDTYEVHGHPDPEGDTPPRSIIQQITAPGCGC